MLKPLVHQVATEGYGEEAYEALAERSLQQWPVCRMGSASNAEMRLAGV